MTSYMTSYAIKHLGGKRKTVGANKKHGTVLLHPGSCHAHTEMGTTAGGKTNCGTQSLPRMLIQKHNEAQQEYLL